MHGEFFHWRLYFLYFIFTCMNRCIKKSFKCLDRLKIFICLRFFCHCNLKMLSLIIKRNKKTQNLFSMFYLHYHTLGTNNTINYKVSSLAQRFQADEGRKQTYTFAKYSIVILLQSMQLSNVSRLCTRTHLLGSYCTWRGWGVGGQTVTVSILEQAFSMLLILYSAWTKRWHHLSMHSTKKKRQTDRP